VASRFYGKNFGQTEFQIVEGASTNSTDMELSVDLVKLAATAASGGAGNWMVQQFLDELKNYFSGKGTRIT
jgi:hypothetical protein